MVLMDVKFNNIYGFNKFHMNFSYPRKLKKTTIANENIPGRLNFRYKKAIILMGSNATGKTTLGKALLSICNYIIHGTPDSIVAIVGDNKKPASYTIEYVQKSTMKLIRFTTNYYPYNNPEEGRLIQSTYSSCDIRENDSYEKCKSELDNRKPIPITPSSFDTITDNGTLGFRYRLTESSRDTVFNKLSDIKPVLFLDTLNKILRTLDPSFDNIVPSKEIENSYIINRGNQQIIIKDGNIDSNDSLLSTGTKEGVDIAIIVAAIRQHLNGFYYVDEQFSHIQSDLEKRIFSTMVRKLGPFEQLIFTTHNADLMDLNIPKHSYAFLRKEKIKNEFVINVTFASEKLKRDTDCLRCAEENDVFESLPDESLLDILDEQED